MSDGGYTGYGLWANFERDRKMFEARQSGATYREIGEKFGIGDQTARGSCEKYRRFRQMPPEAQRILGEIGRRGVAGLWSAFGLVNPGGAPVSRLSECGSEQIARIPGIGKFGVELLTAFCEENGDLTEADLERVMNAMRHY